MKKAVFIIEGIIQSFIGLGAFISGILMMLQPDGSMFQMPLTMLNGSPFNNFLIPGLILLSVNGIGNMIAAILSFRKHKLSGFAGIFFGSGLIIWIFVQVSMIGGGHWLQYFYFSLGMVELFLGFAIREVQRASIFEK
jgi:hypothetical protein